MLLGSCTALITLAFSVKLHTSLPIIRQLSILVSNVRSVCPSTELKEAVEDVLPSLVDQGVTVLLMTKHCDTPGLQSFSDKVDEASDAPLPQSLRSHITFKSPAVYIYTSGTTGIRVAAFTCFVFQYDGINWTQQHTTGLLSSRLCCSCLVF